MRVETEQADRVTREEARRGVAPASSASSASALDLLVILAARKRFILAVTMAVGLLGLALAFMLRPTYTATAVIMTPQTQQSSLTSLMSSSPLAALAGGSAAASLLKDPNAVYIGILKSRTVADDVIRKFDLKKLYKQRFDSQTRKSLASHSSFTSAKDSLIQIEFKDHDPRRAAEVANAYVDELFAQNSRLAITEASYRRAYLERQLASEKDRLADAEVDLKRTQEQTGVFQANTQAQASIIAIEGVRANMTAKQVELQSLQQAATSENPQVIRLRSELEELRSQLASLEQKAPAQPGNVFVPTAKVPEVALEYTRKVREVKYHETLFELLARQYEAARLDEARTAPAIQVVDKAEVPDRRSGPYRLLIVLGALFAGLLGAIFWILFRHYLVTLESDLENGPKLAFIRSQFGMWRAPSPPKANGIQS